MDNTASCQFPIKVKYLTLYLHKKSRGLSAFSALKSRSSGNKFVLESFFSAILSRKAEKTGVSKTLPFHVHDVLSAMTIRVLLNTCLFARVVNRLF